MRITLDGCQFRQDDRSIRFNRFGVLMFAAQRILSSTLIALVAATGSFASMSVGDVNSGQCCSLDRTNHRSHQSSPSRCCGACSGPRSQEQRSCCQSPEPTRVCTCSVQNDQPVIPRNERRDSDERQSTRSELRSVDGVTVVREMNGSCFESQILLASLPSVRRHAVLCCWLT